MEKALKYYEQGNPIRLIESSYENFKIDILDAYGLPADLTGASAFFHLMEFSTRNHIWSKECAITYDSGGGYGDTGYPFTVTVVLDNSDTSGLEGHYTGQLELTDHNAASRFPFEIEIIIKSKASV